MRGPVDLIFACLLVAVVPALEYTYFWPRFRSDVAAERAGVRARRYRQIACGEWLFTLAALAIWAAYERPWSDLSLSIPQGWRLVVGAVLDLAALALIVLQIRFVGRLSREERIAARFKLGSLGVMLPRRRDEYRWFLIVSVTAGVCEELLYRGYLPWLLLPWLGATGGMIAAVIIFGIGHAYQGLRGAVKATLAGAVLAGLVVMTRSLIPAMILHALIDAAGGTVGYLLLRDQSTNVGSTDTDGNTAPGAPTPLQPSTLATE
jgi:membrane protease YdiL (CAAX protease family)